MPQSMKQGDQMTTRWQAGVDLSGASDLLFLAARVCGGPADIEIVASLDPDDPFIVLVLITSADSADVGKYYVEIEATFPNGDIITLPDEGYEELIIWSDLGPGS